MESKRLFISFMVLKKRQNKHGLSPIYMRITVDGKRETVGTGVFIESANWDNSKCQIKGNNNEVQSQNNLLSSLKGKVVSLYTELINSNQSISAARLKAKLTGSDETNVTLMQAVLSHNKHVEKRVGFETTKATLTKYETLRFKIETFLSSFYKRKDLLLKELNSKFIVDFEQYLKTEQRIAHNTTTKYIQFLKRIINYSISNDWLDKNPFQTYRCTFKTVTREWLTIDEINLIASKEFSTARLISIRDIFVFSCYTGLAYADIKKLTTDEIVNGLDGNLWIQTFRAKTQTRVPIPLLEPALNILRSYAAWRDGINTKRVFPVPSNQKVNSYLKEIADLCGIKKMLTFHIARHSFATSIALNNGVPIETVSKLLGHTNIKTTQIYAKVLDHKIASDMKDLNLKIAKRRD